MTPHDEAAAEDSLEDLANECGLSFLSENTPAEDLSDAVQVFARRVARFDDLQHKRAKSVCEQRLKQGKLSSSWRTLKAHFERERTTAQRIDNVKAGGERTQWKHGMTLTGKGGYAATAHNFMTVLNNDAAWRGVIAKNDRTGNTVFRLPPPWSKSSAADWEQPQIEDEDYALISSWFETSEYALLTSPKGEHLYAAVLSVARANRFDPVRMYMDSLKWDGVPRLNAMLHSYFAADGDEEGRGEYVQAVSSMWMISAVARVYQPGCKVDTVLVLKGPQGVLKSTAFRVLAGDGYFCDDAVDLENKDSWMRLHSCFIAELGEMAGITRAEVTSMKAFVSRQMDKFREPYARVAVEHMRRFVFCASTNEDEFFKDITGNRRFWVIMTRGDKKVDIARLKADRSQLWAEAVHRYRAGEQWWMTDDKLIATAKAEQDAYVVGDIWDGEVAEYVNVLLMSRVEKFVRVTEILEKLGKRTAERTNADKLRVVSALKRLGFEQKRARVDGPVERVYVKVTA